MTEHSKHSGSDHGVKLTAEELACLRGRKEGKSTWEMASILGCSEATINFHIVNTRTKLGVQSDEEAIGYGIRHGLID
ncbi:LuxR C-terminal-related transcriptional regulator [Burkholderia ubonensis]|uniref:helix-turn-helix transcriptional regulator n=1 Tax=Burkholderia ubonensis TaxID=101571 RepID=UPI0009B451D3|nr:LuxR C-terminal-related transcriptional regulator [Burkholderia ubonensis]